MGAWVSRAFYLVPVVTHTAISIASVVEPAQLRLRKVLGDVPRPRDRAALAQSPFTLLVVLIPATAVARLEPAKVLRLGDIRRKLGLGVLVRRVEHQLIQSKAVRPALRHAAVEVLAPVALVGLGVGPLVVPLARRAPEGAARVVRARRFKALVAVVEEAPLVGKRPLEGVGLLVFDVTV